MSSALRSLSRAFGQTAKGIKTQRRSVGDLPCKTDPHIEAWVYQIENLEETFKFTNRNVVTLAITVVAVPYVIYKLVVADFDKKDDVYGRQRREFM